MLAVAALFAQFCAAALLGFNSRGTTNGFGFFDVLGLTHVLALVGVGPASAGRSAAATAATFELSRTAAGRGVAMCVVVLRITDVIVIAIRGIFLYFFNRTSGDGRVILLRG